MLRLLWIPHTGWHIPQRAHLFSRALAERHEVHVTDWVADFSSVRDYLAPRYLRNFAYRRYYDDKIAVHGIPRVSPALPFMLLRRINQLLFSKVVQYIIRHKNIDVVVGTFVCPPPTARRLIFDLFDENVAGWQKSNHTKGYAREIESVEHAYISKADVIVTSSSVLAEKVTTKVTKIPVYLIPNGIDVQSFQNINGDEIRQELRLTGKVAGIVGNHDNLAELEIVIQAAELYAHTDITFVIAGRGKAILPTAQLAQKKKLKNVRFVGYVSPERLPKFLAALDVGICSYRKTRMDDARSPMRLIAYAASGLPTVCTDLEEVRRMKFPNVIIVDDTPQALLQGITQAIQLPRQGVPEIEQYDIHRLVKEYEAILQG